MDATLASLYADHVSSLVQRHRLALEQENFDWLVLYSGLPRYLFLDDRQTPHAANPHFRTWVPLPAHAGGAVILGREAHRPRLVFLQPDDYWHGAPEDPDAAWASHFDLQTIKNAADISAALLQLSGRIAVVSDDTAPQAVLAAGRQNPERLLARLHFARAGKTAYETECVRRANRIAIRGHAAAEQAFRDGAPEFDIHIAYCRACQQDTPELPYDNIVALNEHGAILHYTDRDLQPPEQSRSFLIDAGAAYNGYAADITRTYSRDDDEFAALIASMDKLQRALCSSIQPGCDYVALHREAHRQLAAILTEHDIVNCSAEAAVENGITRAFFPHGLGHYIGTQVHDVGGHQASETGGRNPPPDEHPFLRLTRKLTPGAILTIEPGLYFIDMLLAEHAGSSDINWNRVDEFRPYGGIRIEDDVHVNETGVDNLTREAWRQA